MKKWAYLFISFDLFNRMKYISSRGIDKDSKMKTREVQSPGDSTVYSAF